MRKPLPKKKLINEIKNTIEALRVYINNDGGDISFVSFDQGILTIEISGACVGCASFSITFDQGIREALLTEFKNEIRDVKFITATKKF